MKTQLHGSYFLHDELMPKAYTGADRWPVKIDLDTLTLQLTDEQAQALFDSLAMVILKQTMVILKQKVARMGREQAA